MTDKLLDLSLDELLTTTRTVRKRLDFDRPVPRELIKDCIDIALQAPNGTTRQEWNWIVIDDPTIKSRAADLYREGYQVQREIMAEAAGPEGIKANPTGLSNSVQYLIREMQNVPVIVIPTIAGKVETSNVTLQASQWGSVLPATWNFMLALRARGLGSAWTTIHLHREKQMAELLGIPYEETTQAGLFPVGYTKGIDFKPGPRVDAGEVIHWNQW
jgi:nitroreductase